ncbi:hypothetical protein PLICRDRAFT_180796 [Plicaturopsis crispa FD-325 SS-3]|uniref:U4/U6 snRNA-associated-splicing factor PRP24 n=1 Tax=Plicaturopsis crispa FD-325 SS-3 TaxID=944288 RepID=A0A0C9SPV5_PLICR|nr:hypothetical protein PLICRDRAFT_180796 [Plicaturopsis crispa FD-325 SS-3]
MDDASNLEALANMLTELSQNPYDISLHAEHIRLSKLANDDVQLQSALELATNYLAAIDDVWIPLIEAKQRVVEDATELLGLYEKAESDYLSIPILRHHLVFLVEKHAQFQISKRPTDPGDLFSTQWTHNAISSVVAKGSRHLTESQILWDMQREWEFEILEATPESERALPILNIEEMHLRRLEQPHSTLDDTFQSYSTFTSNYKPPQEYESLLVAASKIRAKAVKSYERREANENALVREKNSLAIFAQYTAVERRARYPDLFVLSGAFERAIAEAAKQSFQGDVSAESALRSFWISYLDALRINDADEDTELDALRRAVRSVPGSGEVWARFMRYLERSADPEVLYPADRETVAGTFDHALSTNLVQKDVEQIVPLFLARAGYEKRVIESGKGDEMAFSTLVKVLEQGIELVRQTSPTGDPRLRLEKYLTEIYIRLANMPENAVQVWQITAKVNKTSYLVWISYTEALIKQDQHAQARNVFSDIATRNMDWPEAIWEAWIAFENLYGSVDELEACMDKVEKAQTQVNHRRAKEAEKAQYEAMQLVAEQQAAYAPVTDVAQGSSGATDVSMDVDAPEVGSSGTKRKAEQPAQDEGGKRARTEQKQAPPLKRDRENSTVFVADIPAGVTEQELTALFKDCGKVREVKITQLPNNLVATVEFFERDSVPAALTKDKKRIRDQEIAVHLAWKSTLYVANFPESSDDASMRSLFGKYGIIFDVRWPSKKFKNTRRFCYVQFTSPSAAEHALELHSRELEPGHPMNVYVSNPERRKERSDADANEREIYVAGLSKFTTKPDLERLFKTYGAVKEVRMATELDGNSKGFAFVEFEQEKDAQAALGANNYELKKRRIAVTLADSRVRARNRNLFSDSGLGRKAETKIRSVRCRNLPPGTQEGLLQQVLEKHALVKRVEVFVDQREAVVELENPAEAGKLLLRSEPIVFGENTLTFSEEGRDGPSGSRPAAPPPKTGGLFVPRAAVSRPRAGLGHSKKLGSGINAQHAVPGPSNGQPSQPKQGKAQDDFRKMLGGS